MSSWLRRDGLWREEQGRKRGLCMMTDELYCGHFDGYELRMDRYISVGKGKVRGPEGYFVHLTLQETVMYRKWNAGLREVVG